MQATIEQNTTNNNDNNTRFLSCCAGAVRDLSSWVVGNVRRSRLMRNLR